MISNHSISIVMTTYNGQKYVKEQLISLASQTQLADEIIVYDDCSNDNTVSIIQSFSTNHPNANIHLHVNAVNLGWKKNFMQAIANASGDYIFLSDQDDIWKKDKIEKTIEILEKRPEIDLVATNFDVLNNRGGNIQEERESKNMLDDRSVEPVRVSPHFANVGHPGCTYCFRRELFQECYPLWTEELAHDKLLWIYAMFTNRLFVYNYKSILFRRHENNASGRTNIMTTKDERISAVSGEIASVESIFRGTIDRMDQQSKYVVTKYLEYQNLRKDVLVTRSIKKTIKMFVEYREYFFSIQSFFKDVYIAFFR